MLSSLILISTSSSLVVLFKVGYGLFVEATEVTFIEVVEVTLFEVEVALLEVTLFQVIVALFEGSAADEAVASDRAHLFDVSGAVEADLSNCASALSLFPFF